MTAQCHRTIDIAGWQSTIAIVEGWEQLGCSLGGWKHKANLLLYFFISHVARQTNFNMSSVHPAYHALYIC